MAERTLKIADHDAISDDDPFAELTRIMGFDPRQPVNRQDAPDPVMGDDFDIDLEKELMGEFGLDEEESLAAASASAPRLAPEPQVELAAQTADDVDEAGAGSLYDIDFDFDFAAEEEGAHAASPQVEFDRDFDDALTQSFETDAQAPDTREHDSLEQDWQVQGQHEHHWQEAPASLGQAAAPQDLEAHFDAAMADVDMDFELGAGHADEPAPVAAFAADEPVSFERERETDVPFDAPEAADAFEDAFSLHLSEHEIADSLSVVPAAAVQSATEERSLEDELNALLGHMGARISKPEGVTAPHAWAASAGAASAVDPFAVAGAGYGARLVSAPQAEVAAAPTLDDHDDAALADIDFSAADFEAFDTDSGVGHEAPVPAAPVTPIFSRSWNRATPVGQAEPVPPEAPAQVEAEQTAVFAPSDQVEFSADPVDELRSEGAEEQAAPVAMYDEVPDVETVDVPERVEALADDLDLPELTFEEDQPAMAFQDLDAEFAGLINDMNDADVAPVEPKASAYEDEPYQAGFAHAYAHADGQSQIYAAQVPAQAAATPSYDEDFATSASPDMRPFAPSEVFAADGLDYDPDLDEAITVPDPAMAASAAQPRRRGLMIAAVVAGVALVGGIGAFSLSPGGSGGDGAPVLVKADDAPIKVKPENPGGAVVPNQDNKVYEAVAKGIQPAQPEQQKLVADTQQPVNVNTAAPQNGIVDLSSDETDDVATAGTDGQDAGAAVASAKSEDRIAPAIGQEAADEASQDVALVTPRKVRTMIVKPDGTLAPREDIAPAAPPVAAAEPTDPAPQQGMAASGLEQTGTVPAPVEAASGQPAAQPPAAKAKAQPATTPQTVAAVPQRPSDQPVDIVGEVKPDEVASISPNAAASGSWSMQIASQPSAEAAQSTYKDLARRYASVLNGQPVNIVQAEVAGKGTFYRVRVPANSRNDAIKLCESYKAAGGNCFVSK